MNFRHRIPTKNKTNYYCCRVRIVLNSTETKNLKESRPRDKEEVGQR